MSEITVVIITKNQAWNIGRLLKSVVRETQDMSSAEVVVVDSASVDTTVEIACEYAIRILRLHPNQHLGPAAGRFVGYRHTTKSPILFLDGDMEMYPQWLAKAMQMLIQNHELAAITGEYIQLPRTAAADNKPATVNISPYEHVEPRHFGGAVLCRREVLDRVGCYNPYLCSDEEPDLCIRIRRAGYKIVMLRHPMVYEYTDPKSALGTKLARWRRNLYLGAGQNLRYHLGRPTFWPYVRERGYGLAPLLWLAIGALALGLFITGRWSLLAAWGAVTSAVLISDMARRRSVYTTLASVLERLLIAESTVRGFVRRPLPPESYSGRHDVIK
jgi:glycosyltransferase involved in cell wall biosynthesis